MSLKQSEVVQCSLGVSIYSAIDEWKRGGQAFGAVIREFAKRGMGCGAEVWSRTRTVKLRALDLYR